MAARSQVLAYKEKHKDINNKVVDIDNMEPGIKLHGVEAVHPLTRQRLPVYVATYVVGDYGPGALMGVPLHDERDCAFALVNNLPLIQVLTEDEEPRLVNSTDRFNGLSAAEGAKEIVALLKEM